MELLLLLIIVFIFFGEGKVPQLGEGSGRDQGVQVDHA
jgi:Sec-independent protein translocase protein TatA